jgi:hypothetical protein
MAKTLWSVCDVLESHGRDVIRDYFRVDGCIEASAIVADVFKAFQIPARAVHCAVNIFNPAAIRFLKQYGESPVTKEREAEWNQRRCKWVAIAPGATGQSSRYQGHVAVIAGADLLVDLTLDQANRPEFELVMPPIFQCLQETSEVVLNIGRCRLEYFFDHKRRDFEQTTAWRKHGRRVDAVQQLVRLVHQT